MCILLSDLRGFGLSQLHHVKIQLLVLQSELILQFSVPLE
jgi:hypothetical protein